MAQFDVYLNPDLMQRERTPYLLDIQNSFLERLATRVVVPMRRAEHAPLPMRELNPAFEVQGQSLVLDTAALAAIPVRGLGQPVVSLRGQSSDVVSALDVLFGGH
jgi:toxin CcdB